jgi:hypothetical protein
MGERATCKLEFNEARKLAKIFFFSEDTKLPNIIKCSFYSTPNDVDLSRNEFITQNGKSEKGGNFIFRFFFCCQDDVERRKSNS